LCGHIHERFRFRNVICAGSSTERDAEGYWMLELVPGQVPDVTQFRPGATPISRAGTFRG
jgi:hypothetical protein